MIQLTDSAVDRMAEMRSEYDVTSQQGLMLLVNDDSELAVAIGEAQEHDQVIERDGEPIVIVPAQLAPTLDGLILDHNPDGFTVSRIDGE